MEINKEPQIQNLQHMHVNGQMQQQAQQNALNVQAQQVAPNVQAQPVEELRVNSGSARAIMTGQQQNARNKKEHHFLKEKAKAEKLQQKERQKQIAKWQETASRMREEQIQRDKIQDGMEFLEQEEQKFEKQKLARAKEITKENQVVSNAASEQIEEYGCASYRQIVLLEEAKRAVEESGGFLYYKEVEPGLAELRPTLPKTVKVKVMDNEKKKEIEKDVPLRRTYNILVSIIAKNIVDEKGELLPNAYKNARKLGDAIGNIGMDPQNIEYGNAVLKGEKALREYHVDEESIAAIKAISKATNSEFIPIEIADSFTEFVRRAENLGGISRESIRKKQEQAEEKMREQNKGKELSREQLNQLAAIPKMFEDAYHALQDMVSLRNLNPDSEDVPLPNACSANAKFQNRLRPLAGKETENIVMYSTKSHLIQNPEKHVQFIIKNKDWIAQRRGYKEPEKTKYENLVKKLEEKVKSQPPFTFTPDELDEIERITIEGTTAPCKYDYHQIGVVGVTGSGSDCITYTIETFAAENTQYMVSPFTYKAAVGRYRGKINENKENTTLRSHEGVNDYYNIDNPIPDSEEMILCDVKSKLVYGEW